MKNFKIISILTIVFICFLNTLVFGQTSITVSGDTLPEDMIGQEFGRPAYSIRELTLPYKIPKSKKKLQFLQEKYGTIHSVGMIQYFLSKEKIIIQSFSSGWQIEAVYIDNQRFGIAPGGRVEIKFRKPMILFETQGDPKSKIIISH